MTGHLVGYYTTGAAAGQGGYQPLPAPARTLDTRYGTGAPTGQVGPGGSITVQVTGRAGVPTSGVSAVVVNLTAVGGSTNSFLTAHPDGTTRPGVSNLNFAAGETVANAAIVKVSPGGAIKVYNSTGSVHVLADVTGFYTAPGGANGTTTTASTYTYNGDGLRGDCCMDR
ncbi:MAG: hypothetical protein ACRCYU_11880 [Nocardioides sp.]